MHTRKSPIQKTSMLAMLVAAGSVCGLSGAALAQPTVVNVSGATLLENLMNARAATNDFIDVDGNGASRSAPTPITQQLAPFSLPGTPGAGAVWNSNVFWGVTYSAVGSGNGLIELISTGRNADFSTADGLGVSSCFPAGGAAGVTDLPISRRTAAYFNRYRFINAGTAVDNSAPPPSGGSPIVGVEGNSAGLILNQSNPFGSPVRSDFTGPTPTFRAIYTTAGNAFGSFPTFTTTTPPCASVVNANRFPFRAETSPAGVPSTGGNEGLSAGTIGGTAIDIAILDVPASYAVQQSGTSSLTLKPLNPGYGFNVRVAANANGTLANTGMNSAQTNNGGNRLAALTGGANLSSTQSGSFNAAANSNTIFDSPVVWAPVAPVISYGVGYDTLRMADLRHLSVTGRLPSGENLVVVTRDSGSGTRNAFQNSIAVDPSWGVGDNLGTRNNNAANDALGASFIPSNKGGNNRVEATVQNNRLSIGYVGPERGVPNAATGDPGWLVNGLFGIPSVINDVPYGGTTPTRPTIGSILENDATGWVIGGPGGFSTFGDPLSASVSKGGLGWMEPFTDTNSNTTYEIGEPFNDINGNLVRDAAFDTRPANLNPAMRNVEAAAFINNFTRSIKSFVADPGSNDNLFTPGELAAVRFVLVNALKNVQDPANPANLLTNPTRNNFLVTFTPTQSVLNSSVFTTFTEAVKPGNAAGHSRAGKVPTRTVATTYSDQALVPAGNRYITEGGALLAAGDNLSLRNLIAGDFDGDGLRNLNDSNDLLRAWRKRNEAGTWSAPAGSGLLATIAAAYPGDPTADISGNALSIEIIGDFNGDGSFNAADVRFWADGLAMTTGANPVLNRKLGFTAVDNSYNAARIAAGQSSNVNFFATILASGKPYSAGDSRANVAGPDRNTGAGAVGVDIFRNTRGFAPRVDARIDANDIDYVYANIRTTGSSVAWSNLAQAAQADLSADINGDLLINQADVQEILDILGVCGGDVNLDGAYTLADRQIVLNSIATPPATIGWATGDVNGDGAINAADRALVCPADADCNGLIQVPDIFTFLANWFAGRPSGDFDGANGIQVTDIFTFLGTWFQGPCS